jgi:hypothetical protein
MAKKTLSKVSEANQLKLEFPTSSVQKTLASTNVAQSKPKIIALDWRKPLYDRINKRANRFNTTPC